MEIERLLKEALAYYGSPSSLEKVIGYIKAREPSLSDVEIEKALSKLPNVYLSDNYVYCMDD